MALNIQLTPELLQSPEGVRELNTMLQTLFQLVGGDADTVRIYSGFGTPEGEITAGVGSMYMRKDGGSDTTIYKKESGTGATGWVAVSDTTDLTGLVQNSIELSSGKAQFVNDEASPANESYYGTNSGGTLGYHLLSGVIKDSDIWEKIIAWDLLMGDDDK